MKNEPAFPSNGYCVTEYGDLHTAEKGMTLRDYFAAKALQGFTSNPADGIMDYNPDYDYADAGLPMPDLPPQFVDAAKRAYLLADAMLAARKGSDDA